jgi:predicted Zn-dependent protease with MMP-like domain
MSDREFEAVVAEALELIPAEFRPYMENVSVVIEEEPSDELLDELDVPLDETLFGLYTGTPLTERSSGEDQEPECITLYRGPLLDECLNREELRYEVTTTVIHEIAHHFGIEEDRLEELGWE